MKRIIVWLEGKLSRSNSANPSGAPTNFERSKPDKDDVGLPKDMQDLVDDAGIKTEYNPYDTAKLHKK